MSRFHAYSAADIRQLLECRGIPSERIETLEAVAAVLPFRVNSYVIDELIDWERIPEDPIFQLTFPQPGMLPEGVSEKLRSLLRRDAPRAEIDEVVRATRRSMNPHPGGQLELNVPTLEGRPLSGMQHKYDQTILLFPRAGQTCHSYCTYCFRWAQFVGDADLKFSERGEEEVMRYLERHPEVTDVILTGGDPLVMRTAKLRRVLERILKVESVRNIRIGTKSPAWWPQRFTTDDDADDLLRCFEEVVASGRHLALMAHYSHARELSTPIAEEAVARIRSTGAVIRSQAPLVRHVNDSGEAWAELWRRQVSLGIVPYYMFVERDTGAYAHFFVPLARALEIYEEASRRGSGLSRTARGPVMSCTPGKVLVEGTVEIGRERAFVLKLLQSRDAELSHRTFLARFDPHASWIDDLEPWEGDEWPWKELRPSNGSGNGRARNGREPAEAPALNPVS